MRRLVIAELVLLLIAFGVGLPANAQEPAPGAIGSISGRLLDGPTGAPLSGGAPDFAAVFLLRCVEGFCDIGVAAEQTDAEGRFRLDRDLDGRPIGAGTFNLVAIAQDHQVQSLDLEVAPSQDLDVGDIRLPLPPVQVLDLQPCEVIPPQGGRCTYTARVRNNAQFAQVGTALSLVTVVNLFGDGNVAEFEASTRPGDRNVQRAPLQIPPSDSRSVEFSFDVPPFAANGTRICALLTFGTDPAPLFNPRGGARFCVVKGDLGFELMQPEAAPRDASAASAAASVFEREPNNTCPGAQDVGEVSTSTRVSGSLDSASATVITDVDFYRFSGKPGLQLTAESLFKQFAVFDSSCRVMTRSLSQSATQLIDFTVPPDGVFHIGFADSFDFDYDGNGVFDTGLYSVAFSAQPDFIGSITGRVVDKGDRRPLTELNRTLVELQSCDQRGVCNSETTVAPDQDGRFRIDVDSNQRRIRTDTSFRVVASAREYRSGSVELELGKDEHAEIGEIALDPPPVQFSNLVPCEGLPGSGGTCTFSVDILNNSGSSLAGTALATVSTSRNAAMFEATTGGADADVTRASVALAPGSRATARFSFEVPDDIPSRGGVQICTSLYLGFEPSPLFNFGRKEELFCLNRTDAGYGVSLARPQL